jgi:hypothetical protein
VKSPISVNSRRHHEPSPASIIGGILALGVVRAIARAQRERDQPSRSASQEVPNQRRNDDPAASSQRRKGFDNEY